MVRARPFWLHRAARATVQLHIQFVTVEVGIQQRDVQELPFAGALAIEKSGSDCVHGVEPGDAIGDGGRHEARGRCRWNRPWPTLRNRRL